PYEQLEPAQQRAILHGTGDAWISLSAESQVPSAESKPKKSQHSALTTQHSAPRFQYKGLFPAIDEAARVSFVYRQKLAHLVSEVPCTTCGGPRLRDDAAAWRFMDRTLGELSNLPLGQTLQLFQDLKLSKAQQQVAGELLREITNRLKFLVDVGLDYLTL